MSTPAVLPADFDQWDKPTAAKPPATLPADFSQWDKAEGAPQEAKTAEKVLPSGADLIRALGLPTNFKEALAIAQEQKEHPFKSILHSPAVGITYGKPAIDMLTGMAKEAYRGAKGTIQGDPLAPLHNAAALNPFAAPVVSQMSEQGLGTPEANATGVVNVAPMIAAKAAPAAARLFNRVAEPAAERLYQSALKPSTAKFAPPAEQVVKTGIQAGIPVSEPGQIKLEGLINDLNDAIAGKIKEGTAIGATVEPSDIAKRLDSLKAKFSKQALPAEDLQTIEDAKKAFLKAHTTPIPVEEAQGIKQGTYQQLKGKYGQLSSARIEAEKSLARGIKEELETQFPEIKNLNAQEAKFLNLDGALEKAVRRIGNHQIVGIGTPIVAGAVGGTAGGPAGITAGILKAVIDDPVVKSRMAIVLNRAGRGSIPLGAATSKIAIYSRALTPPPSRSDEQ